MIKIKVPRQEGACLDELKKELYNCTITIHNLTASKIVPFIMMM